MIEQREGETTLKVKTHLDNMVITWKKNLTQLKRFKIYFYNKKVLHFFFQISISYWKISFCKFLSYFLILYLNFTLKKIKLLGINTIYF